jgi:hypothetical protein
MLGGLAALGTIACLCGNPGGGPLVASGTTPAGVPWTIHAKRNSHGPQIVVEFALKPPGAEDAGYFESLPLPVPYGFKLSATSGSAGGEADEADVSGLAARRVDHLRITLADGSATRIRPTLAPAAVTAKRPWLKALRFYDAWFPKGTDIREVVAFDARGRLIARQKV